jgi:hypothetical protein
MTSRVRLCVGNIPTVRDSPTQTPPPALYQGERNYQGLGNEPIQPVGLFATQILCAAGNEWMHPELLLSCCVECGRGGVLEQNAIKEER